ncbi:MAG: ATP-binding cassette domain-containing protein [Desulfobulbaceae bacterium]|nr:ATP-binding cassette domain-containing protein [Desulfobulbaceae bacterium]
MNTVRQAETEESGTAVRFVEVSKSFGRGLKRNKVLQAATFSIPAGKTTVIAGGSGQGKSVTLKLILGLLKPDSGQIQVFGQDVTRLGFNALRELRMQFGVLFQGSALFDSLNVFENIALPLRERTKLTEEEIRHKVETTLEQLGLLGHEEKFPAQLSGGMKKRVGLARALQLEPKLVLFDEPTTGLDPVMTKEIYELFSSTQKRLGYTAMIVSHDVPQIFSLADQIILLNKGELDTFTDAAQIVHSQKGPIREFAQTVMGFTG